MKFRYRLILLIFFLFFFEFTLPSLTTKNESVFVTSLKTAVNQKKVFTIFSFPENIFSKVYPTENVMKKEKDIYVYPSGQSCGLKLLCDGVLVLSSAASNEKNIQKGDYILSFNDKKISNTAHLEKLISENKDNPVILKIRRDNKIFSYTVYPKKLNNNTYALGLWVRDSAAGLGTLTYFSSDKKHFAALGHSVTDAETGSVMSLKKGELIATDVFDIKKGCKGTPGELVGVFKKPEISLGEITSNDEYGIYGTLLNKDTTEGLKPVPIAKKEQIKTGDAKIISTVDTINPCSYSVKITKIFKSDSNDGKNMIIEVTDKTLLEKTGGIVQGMSGSPIIQNGKLVGAVTHVFVNDPTKGYGIFIENMLSEAEKIE